MEESGAGGREKPQQPRFLSVRYVPGTVVTITRRYVNPKATYGRTAIDYSLLWTKISSGKVC